LAKRDEEEERERFEGEPNSRKSPRGCEELSYLAKAVREFQVLVHGRRSVAKKNLPGRCAGRKQEKKAGARKVGSEVQSFAPSRLSVSNPSKFM